LTETSGYLDSISSGRPHKYPDTLRGNSSKVPKGQYLPVQDRLFHLNHFPEHLHQHHLYLLYRSTTLLHEHHLHSTFQTKTPLTNPTTCLEISEWEQQEDLLNLPLQPLRYDTGNPRVEFPVPVPVPVNTIPVWVRVRFLSWVSAGYPQVCGFTRNPRLPRGSRVVLVYIDIMYYNLYTYNTYYW